MNEQKKHILSVIVNDKPGILFRILELLYRRNYNVEAITGSNTPSSSLVHITIVVKGALEEIEQITRQIAKLPDVKDVELLQPGNYYEIEVVLYKIKYDVNTIASLSSLLTCFGATIIDVGVETIIVKHHGSTKNIRNFDKALKLFEVIDIAYSGPIALSNPI